MKILFRAFAGLAMLCAVLLAGVMTAPMPLLAQAVGLFQQTGTGGVLRSFISKLRETSSVMDFGALCNGSNIDTAAFQAAINWLPQGGTNGQYGGRIKVPYTGTTYPNGGGCIVTALSLNGKSNITIEGDANPSVNSSTSTIYYTGGAAARYIDARDSHGITLKDLTIAYTNPAFTGILVDAGGNTPAVNPTSFGSLSDHFRLLNTRLIGQGTATLLNVDQAQLFEVSGNVFVSGAPSIRGALVKQGSSTTGTFERNSHLGNVGPAIDGCGDTWTFIAENFEPSSTGALNAFGNSTLTPCRSLNIINAWPGDFTGGTTGIFLSYLGDGLTISGGRISGTATSTAVKFLGPTTAVNIAGASIEAFGTGIDFNGMAVDGVKVSPNKFISVTTKFANAGSVTGFDSGAEGNSPSTSRATTGQLLIGQSAADAAWKTAAGDVTITSTGATTVAKIGNSPVSIAPTRAGDIIYWNGTTYVTLPGNNSGTQALVENASGVPSWVAAAGTGTVTSVICGTGLTGGTITTAGTCAVDYATKSDQQTGTATAKTVNPARQADHDSAAKAWVTFTGSTGAILASYNVSGVTRLSAGSWTVNFTTAFATANYVCHVNANGNPASVPMGASATKATGSVNAQTLNSSFVGADAPQVDVACFGRQ